MKYIPLYGSYQILVEGGITHYSATVVALDGEIVYTKDGYIAASRCCDSELEAIAKCAMDFGMRKAKGHV